MTREELCKRVRAAFLERGTDEWVIERVLRPGFFVAGDADGLLVFAIRSGIVPAGTTLE